MYKKCYNINAFLEAFICGREVRDDVQQADNNELIAFGKLVMEQTSNF